MVYFEDYEEEVEEENYVNLISFEMKGEEGYGFTFASIFLYLCMHKEDLKNNDFSNVTAIVMDRDGMS